MMQMTGKRIKDARKAKGLTQKQLAEKMEVAEITIRQYENGQRTPAMDMLKKIAKELDIPFPVLLGIATVIDGEYLADDKPILSFEETMKLTGRRNISASAYIIGEAYDKAPTPVKRTVEVALEPYTDKGDEHE